MWSRRTRKGRGRRFGALTEFEWALIRERNGAGLAAARARGRNGGRERALSEAQVGQICDTFGVSRNNFYRHVHERMHVYENAQSTAEGDDSPKPVDSPPG